MSFIRLLTHSVGLQKREETADEWHGHCGGRLGERIGKGVGAAVSFPPPPPSFLSALSPQPFSQFPPQFPLQFIPTSYLNEVGYIQHSLLACSPCARACQQTISNSAGGFNARACVKAAWSANPAAQGSHHARLCEGS